MTPRQRSALAGITALVMASTGLYLGLESYWQGGSDGAQFIENDSTSSDELSLSASSSTTSSALAGTGGSLDGIGQSTNPTLPSPSVVGESVATSLSTTSTSVPSSTDPDPTEPPTSDDTAADPTDPTDPEPTEPSSSETSTTEPETEPTPPSDDTTTTIAAPGKVNAVELEILQLTNELRADPDGRLARDKPMPDCVTDSFYGITIDPATGYPEPVPALTLSEPVSLNMSRPWAVDMDARDTMSHRPNDSQLGIYGELGIGVSAIGENVAWFQGYPDAQAAEVHFEGWRESDSGHYCALIAGTFTHVGVGHHKGDVKSWAVQNFYRG